MTKNKSTNHNNVNIPPFNKKLFNKMYEEYSSLTEDQKLSAFVVSQMQIMHLEQEVKELTSAVDQLYKDIYEDMETDDKCVTPTRALLDLFFSTSQQDENGEDSQ